MKIHEHYIDKITWFKYIYDVFCRNPDREVHIDFLLKVPGINKDMFYEYLIENGKGNNQYLKNPVFKSVGNDFYTLSEYGKEWMKDYVEIIKERDDEDRKRKEIDSNIKRLDYLENYNNVRC